MSTPQGPGGPPHGTPPEQPADQPAWGRQPPGGWGQPQGDEQGQWPVDPHAGRQPPYGQQPYGRQPGHGRPPAQQPYGQPYGRPPGYGPPAGPQPTRQWPDQGGRQGSAQQGWAPGPQPEQQWGPGYPALPDPHDRPAGRRRLPLILAGAAAAVLAVVAVLGFVTPGFFVTRVFDAAAVQEGVQRVLTQDYGITEVTAVTCAEGIEVVAGTDFDCTATIGGQPTPVKISITGDDGAYQVIDPT